jgi:Ca2+-binding EF-hand superfamily protein
MFMAIKFTTKSGRLTSTLLMTGAFLVLSGCAADTSRSSAGSGDAGQLTDEFNCANRNGDGYIDKAELVYLAECGVVHQSMSGQEAAEMSEKSAFENGRLFLENMDANGDDQISLLEFRAHFNATN